MKVKIKKLHPNAVIPTYSKKGDAGMDLTITDTTNIGEAFTGFFEFRTGIAVEIPEGYVGLVFPRSSISKTPFVLANSVGVIDSGYRGEIMVRLKTDANSILADLSINEQSTEEEKKFFGAYDPVFPKVGDKIAQLIILPYPEIEFEEVEELSNSERNDGGFGSTGK